MDLPEAADPYQAAKVPIANPFWYFIFPMEKPDDANYLAIINFVLIQQVYFPNLKLPENHCDGGILAKEDLGWTFRNDETGKKFKAAIEIAMEDIADNPHGIKGFTYSLSVAKIWSGAD